MSRARGRRRTLRRLARALVLACAAASVAGLAAAPSQSQASIWDRIYSEAQARRGEELYKASCSYCHRDDLSGGFVDDGTGRAPALAGPRAFGSSFADRWGDASVADVLATMAATMPQQQPASLSAQAYVDILSYLLLKNDIPSGSRELPPDVDALQRILITPRPK